MHEMGMSQYLFAFMWINFHIYSLDLSDVDKEQDNCYVEESEELEENQLPGEPIDIYQHQSQNVEETDTNTITNQQHNIVEIEVYYASDYEGSAVGVAAQEVTADTEDKIETTLWFNKIIPLLLRKVSLSFIVVFGAYLSIHEMAIKFSGQSSQSHIIKNKPVK